jgi:NAD(P)-dependent dehydrogenase (short-subunit alcohol dehydrogenase family)
MGRLTDRTIVLTGGAQGIGAAYAAALAAEGARLAICDLVAPTETVDAIREAGGEAFGAVCDVSDSASVASFASATLDRFGSIHGLVNNAAIFASLRPKPFDQITSEEFDRVLQVNVRGTFECIKAVLPTMRKQKYGKIVNIGSGTFFKGTPGLLHYTSSKGAVVALTRVVAREVGGDGIRVNCLAPGFTLSEGIKDQEETETINSVTVASRCLPLDQKPEDLTGSVVFLVSGESDFMTGQTIVVDGGSVMN